eukprot:11545232-Ditylum_brightwellii.AAC.1
MGSQSKTSPSGTRPRKQGSTRHLGPCQHPNAHCYQGKQHRVVFKCVISKNSFCLVGYCFVNDATIVQIAPRSDTPTEELVQFVQDGIDLYAGLTCATGGQVSPDKWKNSWCVIKFDWDKSGKWKLAHNKASLFVNTRKGRIEMKRLPSTAVSRIL